MLQSRAAMAVALGLSLGIISWAASPLWTLVGLGMGLLAFAALKRPEVIVLGILMVVSSAVDDTKLPSLAFNVGTIYLTDVILAVGFGLIVVRGLGEREFKPIGTPLDLPLLAFLTTAICSTGLAVLSTRLPFRQALGEVRTVISYLMFFLVTNLVRDRRQVRFLLRGLQLMATFVAVAIVAQYALGPSHPILPGRVETLTTEGESFGGIARIIPPGESIIITALILVSMGLLLRPRGKVSLLSVAQWGVLALAVLMTFKRNVWIGVALSTLLAIHVVRSEERQRLLKWSVALAMVGIIAVLAALRWPESPPSRLAIASTERVLSLFRSTTYQSPDSSLRSRDIEYKYALGEIAAHPLLGLGLGATYRPSVPGVDENVGSSIAWLHNGHVWLALKTGLLGYCFFAWSSALFLIRGFRRWRSVADAELRGVVLGSALTYLVVLLASMVNPNVMTYYWTPVIATLMGSNEVIFREEEPSPALGERRV